MSEATQPTEGGGGTVSTLGTTGFQELYRRVFCCCWFVGVIWWVGCNQGHISIARMTSHIPSWSAMIGENLDPKKKNRGIKRTKNVEIATMVWWWGRTTHRSNRGRSPVTLLSAAPRRHIDPSAVGDVVVFWNKKKAY